MEHVIIESGILPIANDAVRNVMSMRQDKLLERMRNNPRDDWRITDVETLANRYGLSINRPKGGGYLIEFPDLPGCISDGETIDEAIANGKEALSCWIETAKQHGDEIPQPHSSGQPAELFKSKTEQEENRSKA